MATGCPDTRSSPVLSPPVTLRQSVGPVRSCHGDAFSSDIDRRTSDDSLFDRQRLNDQASSTTHL